MSSHTALSFGRKQIRVLTDSVTSWTAATDLFGTFRQHTDRERLARFDPTHLHLVDFDGVRLTSVSPQGALAIAKAAGPPVNRMLDGFVRKHLSALEIAAGRPPLELTLLPDGSLPVKPRVSSDMYVPWRELEQRTLGLRIPRTPDLYHPALFDQDPTLRPHDPDGDARKFAENNARLLAAADEMERNDPARAAKIAAMTARWSAGARV